MHMKENRVYMVDDAADLLKSVSWLLHSVNIEMKAYQDPLKFWLIWTTCSQAVYYWMCACPISAVLRY